MDGSGSGLGQCSKAKWLVAGVDQVLSFSFLLSYKFMINGVLITLIFINSHSGIKFSNNTYFYIYSRIKFETLLKLESNYLILLRAISVGY